MPTRRPRSSPRGSSDDPIFSFPEAAKSTASPVRGVISADTLYDLAARGDLPGVVRVGNRIFVTRSGLREFVTRGGYAAKR